MITEPYPPLFQQMIGHAKGLFYGRQTVHGPFFSGGFVGTEQFIHREGKPLFHFIGPAISSMVIDFFPILKDVNVIRTWSGLIAQISDAIPVLGYTEELLASCDFNHDAHSGIVDASQTRVSGKRLVKVLTWFDNEWGYANRMLDVASYWGRL